MIFRVVNQPSGNPVHCPFRIVEQRTGREVDWVNRYLDMECLRRLAPLTLRSYAQELLHFLRWWERRAADIRPGRRYAAIPKREWMN